MQGWSPASALGALGKVDKCADKGERLVSPFLCAQVRLQRGQLPEPLNADLLSVCLVAMGKRDDDDDDEDDADAETSLADTSADLSLDASADMSSASINDSNSSRCEASLSAESWKPVRVTAAFTLFQLIQQRFLISLSFPPSLRFLLRSKKM